MNRRSRKKLDRQGVAVNSFFLFIGSKFFELQLDNWYLPCNWCCNSALFKSIGASNTLSNVSFHVGDLGGSGGVGWITFSAPSSLLICWFSFIFRPLIDLRRLPWKFPRKLDLRGFWRSYEGQLTVLDLNGWFRWAMNEPRDVREFNELPKGLFSSLMILSGKYRIILPNWRNTSIISKVALNGDLVLGLDLNHIWTWPGMTQDSFEKSSFLFCNSLHFLFDTDFSQLENIESDLENKMVRSSLSHLNLFDFLAYRF